MQNNLLRKIYSSKSVLVIFSQLQFVSGKKKKKKKKAKENSEKSLEAGKPETVVVGLESSSPEKKKKKKRKKSDEGKTENSIEEKTETADSSPAKKKKKKKKDKDVAKRTEPEEESRKSDESSPTKKKKKKKKGTGDEKSDESLTKKSKQQTGESSDSAAATSRKPPNFDIAKLKAALEVAKEKEEGTTNGTSSSAKSFGNDAAKNRLKSSQFRFLNEKLYTQNGAQSLKMFTTDKVRIILSEI